MANNLDILDAATATKTVKTTDNASVHTPHHNIDSIVSGAIASGAVASGAIASGAVASGAFASGALASGAIASGAIAAGAIAAGATSIADNEDAASASGDRGVKMLVVQLASPTDLAGTDGDYSFLQMSGGRLWCSSTITGTVAATQSGTWNVGTVTTVTTVSTVTNLSQMGGAAISMGTGVRDAGTQRVTIATNDAVPVTFTGSTDVATQTTLASALTALQIMDDWDNGASDGASVSGDVAHDTADAGEPVKLGAKAVAGLAGATLVAANDRTNIFTGLDGVMPVRTHCHLEDIVSGTATNTDGTSTSCIATAGAGVKQYLTSITLSNTSATAVEVVIKSGTTARWTFPVPANTSGVVFNWSVPLPPNAADEAWNFDPSAAATTISCSMVGFKSKV